MSIFAFFAIHDATFATYLAYFDTILQLFHILTHFSPSCTTTPYLYPHHHPPHPVENKLAWRLTVPPFFLGIAWQVVSIVWIYCRACDALRACCCLVVSALWCLLRCVVYCACQVKKACVRCCLLCLYSCCVFLIMVLSIKELFILVIDFEYNYKRVRK